MIHSTHLLGLGTALAALLLVLAGWAVGRRRYRRDRRPGSIEVKVAAIAAAGCTAYSADTSWAFARDYLDMVSTTERTALFAVAELALVSTALMARKNLAVQGTPGFPGTLVWLITTVQVVPAYAESGLVGGSVRAFFGPIMAAVLWHLAMGIEVRIRTGTASRGLLTTLGREARERLLSRLGVANRDRDAAQITRDRATARAVDLATRLAEQSPRQRQSRRGRRTARKLSAAIGRAGAGTHPAQRAALLNQLAARRHALALVTVPLPSPWSPVPDHDTRDRGPGRGQGPGTGSALHHGTVPTDEETGTVPLAGPRSPVPGHDTRDRRPQSTGTGTNNAPHHGTVPVPSDEETGTEERTEAPPLSEHGTVPPGTERRPVPHRRKPTPKSKATAKSKPRSRAPQEPSTEYLVDRVRPHVPELLARDGNAQLTRVQLREILRADGIGCRNDRLTHVLRTLNTPTGSRR
ncbi:hypothetical protein JGS22_015210 [Streptomyces sp. P38-E01]|uniref:Uncharacterized protein n=1 Tax=Streptomyces tardus TaxID=2780544 RepID=A0A949N5G3_9ACTN|nr:hypothetical protein [Streptomyces tardus]MBU7598924.1 hypothetical protein [Streptomyces tardus]